MSDSVLEIVEGPKSDQLVELAAVKAKLGIDAEDASLDGELSALVATVGHLYAGPEGLGRPLWRQACRETLAWCDDQRLWLSCFPVESATVTTLDGSLLEDFVIEDPERRSLYRSSGWPGSSWTALYLAGWLMPGQVADWESTHDYAVGDWVRVPGSLLRYECTTAGQSAFSIPSWPLEPGLEVVDGGAVWTASRASELPEEIRQLALVRVQDLYHGGLELPVGKTWLADEGGSISLSKSDRSLTTIERAVLRGLR